MCCRTLSAAQRECDMQNWAVIVAIQDYPSIFTGLAKKLADANAAAMQFRDWVIAVKSVPPANIIACAGEGCGWRTTGTSRKDIVDAFTQFVTTARVNGNVDELYVFFSGHGIAFSVDPYEPPIDVLIGSDFTEPATSGAACLRFQEIKESLRVAVGPFFFNDTATTEIYPLSLYDALPIWAETAFHEPPKPAETLAKCAFRTRIDRNRSEEHTSELQSPCNLVCRLLLEKKKKLDIQHQPYDPQYRVTHASVR